MLCFPYRKIIYPIAKNRVVGATRTTNATYEILYGRVGTDENYNYSLSSWILTSDDYIFTFNSRRNSLTALDDGDYYCFICY